MTTRFDQMQDFLGETHIGLVFVYHFLRDNIWKKQSGRALVKTSLTVKDLRQELLNKFTAEEVNPKDFGVYLQNDVTPLPLNLMLSQIDGLTSGSEVFLRFKKDIRSLEVEDVLILEVDNRRFLITELPAVIGRHRPSMSDDEKRAITVNLAEIENSDFISRRHARIEKRDQSYFITKIADKAGQKLLVDNEDVPAGGTLLPDEAQITLGMVTAKFIRQTKR